ncbi:MAG TPA: hypothetical protein DC049_06215 [Spirochaetia bacterium]|nr:hypothetical protein [Spirochaetia bacterium]
MVLGLDAGTRFRMGDNVSINDETEFSKTAMESAWSCLDKSGKIIFQGILEADKITKPDKIVFSAMRNPYFAAWDYNNQVKKGKALPDKPEQTSIGIYFDEKPLAAGASIEYVSSLFLSDSPLSIPEDKIIENKDLLIMEYLQKMQSSFSSGDYQEAINNIEYILALNSGHFEAQDYLTRCAEKMAEKKQDEISAEADRPAELFKKISELFKAAKYQEALDLLENFYGTYGREDLEPLQEMIKFKLRQQKLKKITSENPEYDQYTNFKKQAESAYSQQQYVPGLKALLGILKISPYDETALKYLTSYIGKIKAQNELLLSLANLLYKGGVDKAESDPLLAHGYFRILRLALPGFNKDEIAKRFNETMPEYDKPLDADKKNNAMSLIKEAAMLADDSRDYSGAVQKLKSAAALVPQEINLWERMIKNRALAAAYSGFDKTGFISDIKNSVKKNTGVKDSILKADAYLAKKLPAQAKEFYNKALILDPQNSHAEQQLKKIK